MIDSDPQAFLQLLNQATGSDAPASASNPPATGSTTGTSSTSSAIGTSSLPSSSGLGGASGSAVTVTLAPYEQEIIQRVCIYFI